MTTTLTPEQARLVDALDWAAGQDARQRLGLPSSWEQSSWVSPVEGAKLGEHCGTAGCVAGYVAVAQLRGKPIRGYFASEWSVELPDGSVANVPQVARVALGLSHRQADALFDEDNGLSDLLRIGRAILAGEDLDDEDDEDDEDA